MSEPTQHQSNPPAPGSVRRYALILLIVALVLAAWGIFSRVSARNALGKTTIEAATPTVSTIKPDRQSDGEALVLPGSVQAYYEAPIYARTSGYLKDWLTDIGTPVKKGQLLADIDAPEVDQQLHQGEADLATAEANLSLSRTTNTRWQSLLATNSVSKQDADEKAGDEAAKKAALDSAKANVARLHDLESFKRVLAPFDGVVTARNTDIGALINAGESAGTQLFRVADVHKLRIYVQVPQPYAAATTPGLNADLKFSEHPGKTYTATVVQTANALDPNARTLQVELQIDNLNGELFPGSYAEVHFKLPANADSLRIPANTVLFRSAGLQVAVVGKDSHVQLKSIVAGRDFGSSIEVLSGISADDDVVLNPPDSITDGAQIRVVQAPSATQPEAKPQQQGKSS